MKFKRAFGLVSSAALLLSVVSNFASVQTVNAQDPLVIYSNSLTDEREEWIEERATEAGFNLECVSAGELRPSTHTTSKRSFQSVGFHLGVISEAWLPASQPKSCYPLTVLGDDSRKVLILHY